MLPTRTPTLLKLLYPSLLWEGAGNDKTIYLTFDDGPHPTITPWVLDQLDLYGFKAVFFCIGANVKKYPKTYDEILTRGHQTGNHTHNHLGGFKTKNDRYFENIHTCAKSVNSTLFRPPFGHLKPSQIRFLKKRYRIIMWSILTEDWDQKLNCQLKFKKMKAQTRAGDIVVFHDSQKALHNLRQLLPDYLKFLRDEKYSSSLF